MKGRKKNSPADKDSAKMSAGSEAGIAGNEARDAVVAAQVPDAALLMSQMTEMFAALTRQLGSVAGANQAAAPAAVSRPRINVEVPSFSGYTDAKSVHEFLQQLRDYQTALGTPDDELLGHVLPVALVESAARWRRCQPAFQSMADFKDRFRAEFLPPDYERRMLEELASRTQHPEESLLEYIRAMQELYERADPTATDQDQVARVIRQCHPRFKPYLRGRGFANLEALAQEAKAVQADLLAELRYQPPPRPAESLEPGCAWNGGQNFAPRARGAELMAVERQAEGTAVPRALDPYAFEQRRRAGAAVRAPGEPQECAERGGRRPQPPRETWGPPSTRQVNDRLCWNCSRPGHLARECRARRAQGNGDRRRR